MPTKQELRKRLVAKLQELFQLDQPDLDFGFYRIMHTKAEQVTHFLEHDLLDIIETAFGDESDTQHAALKEAYERTRVQAVEFGAPDPDNVLPVREARAKLDAALENANAEGEIYDHLYRFFERYYDRGDFISRRYYTRETAGKAAPFAIPYNGEEVKLHWANADQYYIKTAEHFTNSTFDLNQAPEVQATRQGQLLFDSLNDDGPRRVHFRIVDATEGAHGNVKASDSETRFFLIHQPTPVELNAAGELVINFEYRPDPEKTGQESTWRDKRNTEAVAAILNALKSLSAPPNPQSPVPNPHPSIENQKSKIKNYYLRLLQTPAPTEKDAKRPLLAKYVNRYTGRNTYDYFIHKDLGGFLRRELDFYLKNEVMRLDDIEEADAPSVASYLSRLKVLRRIAAEIITFLAQLEEFQKKLWLKKKFVVETHYCITLDHTPADFYAEIAANDAQREEWVRLYAIDEIGLSTVSPAYSVPLTVEFLRANPAMMVDTQFFGERFKERLIASIEALDELCDGVLVHSENFQALNLLAMRYLEQVACVYIDPPYNTDASPIIYKNGYKSSTWTALLNDRLTACYPFLSSKGVLVAAIDDEQQRELSFLLSYTFTENLLGTICVRSNPSGRPSQTGYSVSHEYLLFAGKSEQAVIGRMPPTSDQMARFSKTDDDGVFEWRNLRREGSNSDRVARPFLYYPIYISGGSIRVPDMRWDEASRQWEILNAPQPDEQIVLPNNEDGREKTWRWGYEKVMSSLEDLAVRKDRSGRDYVYYKRRPNQEGVVCISSWFDAKYSSVEHGTGLLKKMFGSSLFSYPKSLYAVVDAIYVSGSAPSDSTVLDYFAGSGTTGHAVIELNRSDMGDRKYVLTEMGMHFNTILRPRIQKAVYAADWHDGRPSNRTTGASHCFKYLRLESYEDTLNNLAFDDDPTRQQVLAANADLRKDYMLRYLLDVETQGSQSLLNVDAFADPTAYTLKVKKPGSDEYTVKAVDLLETFNYLIGLRVVHIAAQQCFTATFQRQPDPELPQNHQTRLTLTSRMQQIDTDSASTRSLVSTSSLTKEPSTGGPSPQSPVPSPQSPIWWFRKVEGWVPADPMNPNNGQRENVLIIWRKLTGNLEEDNLMLDEWFRHNRINPRDAEFDIIYVNGSNNLANLRQEGDTWKVRLLEEEFMRRMWEGDVLQ